MGKKTGRHRYCWFWFAKNGGAAWLRHSQSSFQWWKDHRKGPRIHLERSNQRERWVADSFLALVRRVLMELEHAACSLIHRATTARLSEILFFSWIEKTVLTSDLVLLLPFSTKFPGTCASAQYPARARFACLLKGSLDVVVSLRNTRRSRIGDRSWARFHLETKNTSFYNLKLNSNYLTGAPFSQLLDMPKQQHTKKICLAVRIDRITP